MCKKTDVRIGAIHRIPSGNIKNIYLSREYINKNKNIAYDNWMNTTIALLKNTNVDIVAHPCMALIKYNLIQKESDILSLFLIAKQYSKKLEISSRYKKANNILIKILIDNPNFSPYISYGSDSHSISDLKKAHKDD